MATLPGTPEAPATSAEQPDVDQLFPQQAQTVDELFPASVERERYRRQTLGTSPIQDLIFGGTEVNPIARILDHFGQGAKQGWGAEPNGLSQESVDALKKAGLFNDYDKGQRSIIKAANESLFRGAATYIADPIMRGLPAAFRGVQEAVAQTGEELGQRKLGREAAGAFEAFPVGLRAPTGIPHPVPHPILAEIERARDLGVIGAGEAGWKGAAEVPVSTVREQAAAIKPDIMESGMHQPVEVVPGEVKPAAVPDMPIRATPETPIAGAAEAVGPAIDESHPIARDVARKLVFAGRPAEEASASGQLIASHYEARAARFGGELGTAEELYKSEGAQIRGQGGQAPESAAMVKRALEKDASPDSVKQYVDSYIAGLGRDNPNFQQFAANHAAEIEAEFARRAASAKSQSPKPDTPDALWRQFARERQARTSSGAPIETGYNAETSKSGAQIRGRASQAWEEGNIVDAGFVKDLLVVGKDSEGVFKLVSKPDQHGLSKAYEFKPHEGISKGKPVDFIQATKSLVAKRERAVAAATEAEKARVAKSENLSLLDFLAREGGLKPTADLKSIFGDQNPTIPGVGRLFRKDGMTMDEALTKAKENSYVLDPNDIQHVPGGESKGVNTVRWQDLQDKIAEEAGGNKQYRNTRSAEPAKVNADEEFRHISDELHRQIEESGGSAADIDPVTERRVVEMVQKGEAPDVLSAYERAAMETEYYQKHGPQSPEFKRWFGESKVVDEAGEPRVVYHVTSSDFDAFRSDRPVFVAFDEKGARMAASGNGKVMELYAKAEHPANTVDSPVHFLDVSETFRDHPEADAVFVQDEAGISLALRNGGKQLKSATGNTGAFDPNSPRIFDQIKRGKIRFSEDGKAVITLFKDANASTFLHETGHHWLEELMKDSEHPKAPAELRADADSVLKWLGVKTYHDIKVRHHEQFARGFERYMMEGKAQTQGLARAFAAFKDWLTRIYQTVDRLKSPINAEIRGVFDRLVALKPEQVKIEPEAPKNFADIHEADALHTAPEAAHPVAETIQAERDRLANEHIPEEHNARLEGIASEASRREAGGPQPLRDGTETARPEETGNDQATGAVGEGGSVASAEGARPSVGGGKTEPPVSPNASFTGPDSALVDKAGNIRLDNLGTAEDVNKAIRDAAAENNDFIDARRGVVTDGQVLELADALGIDAGQLNTRKLGQAYNAEQIMAARKLLIQSATNVRDAMVKAAAGSEADIMAYAEAKARHQMIQEQVAGITAEAGRALRAFRKLEGQQEAGQIDAFLKDATGKTLFQLQREAQLGLQLETPAQISKFVNDSSKPTWKDALVELWMSFLLSGVKTHVANIMGNTISGLWRPLETATAATIGKARTAVTGSHDRVLFGEAAAELFGMVHGSKEGIVAAYKAFKSEEPQMTSTRQMEQGHPKALPSATINVLGREMEVGGKQVRIPLRLLGAEDEFFKSVAFRGDINRQAYAIAAKENLPPEQFHTRVAELSMNPTEAMVEAAKGVADYQTFQTPLGKVGRAVQNFSNSHILAKFIVPFVRTPINLLKYAGERTPLGLFAQEVRDNLAGKNGAVARDTQIARITLGSMVGIAAFEMASQGLITGGGPSDKAKKAIMQADGWQDYSVKVGDMYYRYNRLDPFSVILGLAADSYEISHALGSEHLEKEHVPALLFAAISKNVLNRASLQGASDLIQAVSDPERFGKGYVKGMVGTIVPALAAQTAQTIDPVAREARTVLDGIKARIPGMSQDLKPRRDVWGEPVTRDGGLGPDIASPIMESRIKNDPVNKALMAANYFPSKLDRKIRGVELSDDQYDDYARIAGRMAKVRLNAIVSIPGFSQMPESARKELMTNAVTTSREAARSLIMMQNPEIIKKANDAKVAKLRGEPTH